MVIICCFLMLIPFCDNVTYFEDWWVNPNYVNVDKYKFLIKDKRCNKDIIRDIISLESC